MADSKITALTALTAADPTVDMFPVVDVSDTTMAASGTTKRISINNILACSPSATLASATISGDLTVDTSTLKVDSANNRVGVVNASPAYPLDVTGIINTNSDAYVQGGRLALYRPAGSSYIDIASGQDLVFRGGLTTVGGAGASDFMRLNSTGLGVGVSPSVKGHFYSASGSNGVRLQTGSTTAGDTNRLSFQNASGAADARTGCIEWYDVSTFKGDIRFLKAGGIQIRNSADSPTFNLDDTGNLGIGVTPAGTGGCLQLKSGITFPATQVASSDANTLDDYEEGTWTPTIKGTGTAGTGTYSVQVGTYTKVGRVVHFQGRLTWSAHTGTGDMQIAGIPFTSLSTTNSNSPCNFGYINNLSLAASSVLTGFVFPNTNDIGLYQYTAGGGVASAVGIDTAADIIFSGTYFA